MKKTLVTIVTTEVITISIVRVGAQSGQFRPAWHGTNEGIRGGPILQVGSRQRS